MVVGKVADGPGKGNGKGFDGTVLSIFVLSLNISSLEDECSGSVGFSSGMEYSIIELVKLLTESLFSSSGFKVSIVSPLAQTRVILPVTLQRNFPSWVRFHRFRLQVLNSWIQT